MTRLSAFRRGYRTRLIRALSYFLMFESMKDLQPNILNDYEHLITRAIERWGEEDDFPVLEGLERKALDDYLFEYQRILDSEGSQKAQLTKYGILAILPVIVLSAFPESMLPWGKYSLIAGVVAGVILALLVKGLVMLLVRARLSRLKRANPELAAFSASVEIYQKNKQ